MEKDGTSEGSRQDRKKGETRKKIIDTAMALFEKNGFDVTTMEQIAEEADIARRTLYNHFPFKEAILVEFVQRSSKSSGPALIQMLQQMPDTRTRVIQMLTTLLEWAAMNEDIYRVYFAYRMHQKFRLEEDQSIRSGAYDFVEEIIKLGQQSGELRRDLPLEVLANHLELVYALVIIDLVSGKTGKLLKRSIKENVDIFLDGARDTRRETDEK